MGLPRRQGCRARAVSRFTSHLGLRLLEYSTGRPVLRGDRCLWYLPDPLTYERGAEGSGQVLTVPAFDPYGWSDKALSTIRVRGVTDLTSVPWIGRRLLPADGPYVKAAIPHDDAYVTKGESYRHLLGRAATRKEADDDLMEAMKVLGVPGWKRAVVWSSVRAGGGRGWGT